MCLRGLHADKRVGAGDKSSKVPSRRERKFNYSGEHVARKSSLLLFIVRV